MALTQGDLAMWHALRELGVIPAKPRVLEIGQANWYGDAPTPPDCAGGDNFDVARRWYKQMLDFSAIVAIDYHGKDALPFDLNEPLPLPADEVFDVVINTGTAEHVFDQRQLFRTIHERTARGGLIIHAVPWKGWIDHGFYCYQPTFFIDLARANRYELLYDLTWTCGTQRKDEEVQENVMLYVALRQTRVEPFRVPQQGRYDFPPTRPRPV